MKKKVAKKATFSASNLWMRSRLEEKKTTEDAAYLTDFEVKTSKSSQNLSFIQVEQKSMNFYLSKKITLKDF